MPLGESSSPSAQGVRSASRGAAGSVGLVEPPGANVHGSLAVGCTHCGAPVPPVRFAAHQAEQFCCAGCDTVYHVLQGSGLSEYYAYRERLGEPSRPVLVAQDTNFAEFDAASYQQLYCRTAADGRCATSFLLEGVHCAACVWLVERVGRLEPAVIEARLDIAQARVDVTFDPTRAKLSGVARALARLGYTPRPFRAREAQAARQRELRGLLLRMGVAGACAGNVMLMAFALYSGEFGFEEAGTMDHATRRFFELGSLVVSLPSLWAGGLFFRGAWGALRTRSPHMDLPIAIGILGAFSWGTYGALTGLGHLYFDSITALVFLLLVGRYIQRRHQMAFSEAAELVHAVLPSTALRVDLDGSEREVSRDEIAPGIRVLVRPGMLIPVDGVIMSGTSHLDKSLLSGESRPVPVTEGDLVEAGAVNQEQTLVVEATAHGTQARVAKLMHEVERALSTKTPLTGQADRIAGVFTLCVLGLALLVGALWWSRGPEHAVEQALSVLIVACPCALGMATPLSLSAAVRKAARVRQLIFAPEALERLGRPCELVFDKTGTLTWGQLRVLGYDGEPSILGAVKAIEYQARHPVARALWDFISERGVADSCQPVLDVAEIR
ncbi:MAG TPA: heavy metal translocating P-type ATPase metal-binding domain-containing protein, partial [Polyangiaceae bacterium]|nr:heavy metal translocating P-type ATPase metal-binding domain-containing protein [Polyangiaceae bacterium]